MSIKAMTWAWELAELPLRESMVLLALADAANDDGLCWPSQETLALKARSSTRSVKRAIAILKEAELIEVIPRSSIGGRKANLYRVCVGVEYSAESRQRAKLALSETEQETPPVDNPIIPRETGKGPNWHFADPPVDNVLQSANSGPPQSANSGTLLPYGENPHIEPPTNQAPVGATPSGVVGDGSIKAQGAPPAGEAHPDWGLLDECLPAPMRRGLSRSAGLTITKALKTAEAAGWSRGRIYRALNENPLPETIRNRTGLVIHRVQALTSIPQPQATSPRVLTPPSTRPVDPVPMPDWFKEKFSHHQATPLKESLA